MTTAPQLPEIQLAAKPSDTVRLIVDDQTDRFERFVLAAAAQSFPFFERTQTALGGDQKKSCHSSDSPFRNPLAQAVYDAIAGYFACMEVAVPPPMSPAFGGVLLQSMVEEMVLAQDEVADATAVLEEILAIPIHEARPVACEGFVYWFKKKGFEKITTQTHRAGWDPDVVLAELQAQSDPLTGCAGTNRCRGFGIALEEKVEPVERLPSGLHGLDKALGGGFGKGEFSVVLAGTGVGKSQFACQVAATFAQTGRRGLLISTEEDARALETRIVSNFANIPFAQIKDGFSAERLMAPEAERYRKLRERLGDRLFITEWLTDRGSSIRSDLEREIKRAAPVDFVVLDWIGGALGSTKTTDPHELRLTYQNAADHLASLASKHRIAVIAMAQANPLQSRNKPKVDSTMLSECKTMGRQASNIIGISGLLTSEDDGPADLYRDFQYLYVSKARKASGGLVQVKREFAFQRLRDASRS